MRTGLIQRICLNKGDALLPITALVSALLWPAIAQAEPMPQTVTASTGTLLAAALETLGYGAQARILAEFGETLRQLGALVYVCCIVGAVMTIAMLGTYRAATWFLIGPVIFFYLTQYKVQASGADWQFGVFRDQQGELEEVLKGVDVEGGTGVKEVSWFFHHYNVVVSDIVQNLVKLITDKKTEKQMKFMLRQNLLNSLYNVQIADSGLIALTKFTMANCAKNLNDARMISHGQRYPEYRKTAEYQRAEEDYCRDYRKKTVTLTGGVWLDFLNEMRAAQSKPEYKQGDLTSCDDLWYWMWRGAYQLNTRSLAEIEGRVVPRQADRQYVQEVYKDIRTSLTQRPRRKNGQVIPQVKFQCKNSGAGGGDDAGDAAGVTTDDRSRTAAILAGYLLRKQLIDDPRSNLLSDFARRGEVYIGYFDYTEDVMSREQRLEYLRRHKVHEWGEQKKVELLSWAMTLPIVQGFALYALALTFPFFALMVIVPGKAGSFFAWMALWAWLKVWDVGWALVMTVDNVLWELMPKSAIYHYDLNDSSGYFDPVSVLETTFHGDHGYNLATYYHLMALLISGVPMFSGQFVLGAKNAINGVLVEGLKSLGQTLGGSWADYISHKQVQRTDEHRNKYLVQETMAGMKRGPANARMAAMRRTIDDKKKEGEAIVNRGARAADLWMAAGLFVLAGACLVAAFLTSWTGIGLVLFVGLAAAAGGAAASYGTASASKKEGLGMQREANAMEPDYIRKNMRYTYWNAVDSPGFRQWDEIRGGLSLRGEYWNVPDAPVGFDAQLDNLVRLMRADIDESKAAATAHHYAAAGDAANNFANVFGYWLDRGK